MCDRGYVPVPPRHVLPGHTRPADATWSWCGYDFFSYLLAHKTVHTTCCVNTLDCNILHFLVHIEPWTARPASSMQHLLLATLTLTDKHACRMRNKVAESMRK